jgi:hypothetical protein
MQVKPNNSLQKHCEIAYYSRIQIFCRTAKASSFFSPREAYRQFKENPSYSSLRFKKVYPELRIYSARISNNYRAIGQLDGDTVLWF